MRLDNKHISYVNERNDDCTHLVARSSIKTTSSSSPSNTIDAFEGTLNIRIFRVSTALSGNDRRYLFRPITPSVPLSSSHPDSSSPSSLSRCPRDLDGCLEERLEGDLEGDLFPFEVSVLEEIHQQIMLK